MRSRWLLLLLLIVLGLASGSSARAQLLYSGGEDIDFFCNSGGTCSVTTTTGNYRSGWAREAYAADGTTSDPPTNRFATPVFSANSTLWIHAQFCVISFFPNSCANNNTSSNTQMLRIFDSSGNPTLVVRGTGTAGQLQISSRTAGGTFTTLATCSSAFAVSITQLDLYVNYGTSGQVTLYSNSGQVCTYSGNVTNGDGATTLDQVEFASPNSGNYAAWSEVIIATSDTRAMSRFTANTSGDGSTTGFSSTGGDICSTIWNATSYNDSNYGYSGASNVVHECKVNSSIPAGSYSILGLVMSARALVGTTGPQHFQFVTGVNGTNYTSSDLTPTTSFSNFTNYIQTANPATSNPWAVSDFQASGFNVGEETQP